MIKLIQYICLTISILFAATAVGILTYESLMFILSDIPIREIMIGKAALSVGMGVLFGEITIITHSIAE